MDLNSLASIVIPALPIRKKTLATYRSMYRCHIEKKIGKLSIDEINRSDIKNLIIGLPPQTAMMVLAVIKVLFREALENEYLEKSPVDGFDDGQRHLGGLWWKGRNELLDMGAFNLGEIEFAYRFFDMAAIHRSIGNQRFVTDRKIADRLRSELIEFQFFLRGLGKEVIKEIVP